MKVILKKLKLTNFKGIKDLKIDFNEDITYICGDNGTGKTTIFDAFLWLLFGKDSQDRKDFGIKTLDKDGQEIHKIEHNVTAVIEMNGKDKVFSRTLREKWVKKKGSTEEVFDGNETLYEIDNVPLKQSEYIQKTAVINEDLFKLITNPLQFCNMAWKKQRDILTNMSKLNSDLDIAVEKQLQGVTSILKSGKTVEERVKELANSKKKINREIQAIPVRIDEVNRTLMCNNIRTVDEVNTEITETKENIRNLEKEINFLNDENTAKMQIETRIRRLQSEMAEAEAKHKVCVAGIKAENDKAVIEYNRAVEKLEYDIKYNKKSIENCNCEIKECNKLMDKLREDFKEEKTKKFSDTVCPTCGREWKDSELNERLEHFNKARALKLDEINERGRKLKSGAENTQIIVLEKTKVLESLIKELEVLKSTPVKLKEIPEFNSTEYIQEIEQAKSELENNAIDTSEQEAEIVILNSKLTILEQELADVNGKQKCKERIAELEASLKAQAQAVADIEKEEAELKEFTEAKINMLGEAVNSKFKLVKFKLYDMQINGGYAECCEATVNGVPYRDLNNAMKINAGLDIINTLQKYYGTSAPVFVDNKESVNELISLESQLICLVVTADKELIINKEAA